MIHGRHWIVKNIIVEQIKHWHMFTMLSTRLKEYIFQGLVSSGVTNIHNFLLCTHKKGVYRFVFNEFAVQAPTIVAIGILIAGSHKPASRGIPNTKLE